MAWFFGKKEEKPVENKMPEQSERQYNLFWMIRMLSLIHISAPTRP